MWAFGKRPEHKAFFSWRKLQAEKEGATPDNFIAINSFIFHVHTVTAAT